MSTSVNVLRSSSLLLLIKFIQRGVGIFSTILLARLLVPEDFGIVAISLTIIYFIEAISSLGTGQYIIQSSHVTNEMLNTAWTVNILIKSVFLLGFLLIIPYIAEFYKMPQLTTVLYASSSIIILNAVMNPGLFMLKKNFNYKPIFWLSVTQKILSFIVVIFIALLHPSYWAMVFGDIVSAFVLAAGSYKIHSFRPRFSLQGFVEQWLFSKWIILRGIVGYTRSQFDTFIVSTVFPAQQLGGYHMVRQLSIMPSTEIIAPAVEPLLSAFSLSKNQTDKLGYHFRVSFLIVNIVTLPVAGYLWLFPEPIIDTLLGQKWAWTYQYLSGFAIFFISIALVQILAQLCMATGRLKGLLVYEFSSLVIIVAVLWMVKEFSLYNFIIVRGLLGIITVTGLLLYLNSQIKIRLLYLVKSLFPVVISAFLSTWLTKLYFDFDFLPFFRLICTGFLFLSMYTILVTAFYRIYFYKFAEWQKVKEVIFSQVETVLRKLNFKQQP